jgi:mono/diheme cytochrome c family protein
MKIMKTMKLLVATGVLMVLSMTVVAQSKAWEVPAKFKSMKNPVASNDASIKAGQSVYARNCAMCHGKNGLGDGPKVRALKTVPNNFTLADFQNQTDGEHFYKTKTGRGDMPKYEGKLTDNDIWNVVNFMRTFKK